MVLFQAPFMVILLTVVMLQASAELTALIVLAVAAVMIVQPYILAAIASRQARPERTPWNQPAAHRAQPTGRAVNPGPQPRSPPELPRPVSIRNRTTKLTKSVRPKAIIAT